MRFFLSSHYSSAPTYSASSSPIRSVLVLLSHLHYHYHHRSVLPLFPPICYMLYPQRHRHSNPNEPLTHFLLLRPICLSREHERGPIDGDGTAPETRMFAKFPRTPSDSTPGTPSPGTGQGPRRRIRCKMCRCVARDRLSSFPPAPLSPDCCSILVS